MYSFLTSPKWLAGHLLALIGLVLFVSAGFWQVSRLQERREYNATVNARLAEPERPLPDLLNEVGPAGDDLAYRRVKVTGTYRTEEEVLLSTRSHRGNPGHHLLTPLVLPDGSGVIVDRGWVPMALNDPPVAEAAPVSDEPVTVRGVLFPTEQPGPFTPDPEAGRARFVREVDIPRLQQQVSVDLAEVYVLAQEQQPAAAGELPLFADMPPLDEGNHLSYAIQWFIFATVVLVGYPLLIRRTAQDRTPAPPVPPTTRERVRT